MEGKALQLEEVLLLLKESLVDFQNKEQEVVLSGKGGYTCTKNMLFVRIEMTNIDKFDLTYFMIYEEILC